MMLEIWKEATDDNKAFIVLLSLLIYQKKAFDFLSHDLLTAKLYAYGLDLASLTLLQDNLTNRKRRTKVGCFYSTWEKYHHSTQRLYLVPLLFNIVICDMFFIMKNTYFTDYADGNTSFVVRDNRKDGIKALEESGKFHKMVLR